MTRPREYSPWSPRSKTELLTDTASRIIDYYQSKFGATHKQLFYILLTRAVLGKTERDQHTELYEE